jgi:hypothetical protein
MFGTARAARRLARRTLPLAGAFAAIALTTTGASAQAALVSTGSCDSAALTAPFAPWGDQSLYKLMPGGDFSGSLAGWTINGGARVVSGGEPVAVAGAQGGNSLLLPAGASVQTPFTCVNAADPTFRFFGRNNSLLSTVAVSVVYNEPLVGQVAVPVGVVALSGSWQPTSSMLTLSAVQGVLSGGTAQVALRFTAVLGAAQIDDVYVDPRMT